MSWKPGRGQARRREAAREKFSVTDEVSCYFDTAAEPANVHLELHLPGQLDRTLFRHAAITAIMANRRASSRRAAFSALATRFWWERPAQLDTDPVQFATYADASDLAARRDAFLARSPSIDSCPPASLLLASGPQGDFVILNGHHAAMDGVAWLELLREVGRRYRAGLASSAQPDLAHGAPDAAGNGAQDRFAAAGQAMATAGAGTLTLPDRRTDSPVTTPVARRPAGFGPLASRPARVAAEHGGHRGCGLHLLLLDRAPVPPDDLGFRATVNDVLIAALALNVSRWNAGHGKKARRVRVTMPINTRSAWQAPAPGNQSRIVPVRAAALVLPDELPALLRTVARQARAARETPGQQLGIATRALAATPCPTWLKRWLVRAALRLAGPAVCDTAMVSNLGKVADPPDFGLPGTPAMAFSVPAQMPRGISVAVITAGGSTQLGFRYNRALLDQAAAIRFAAGYQQALADVTRSPARGEPAPRPG